MKRSRVLILGTALAAVAAIESPLPAGAALPKQFAGIVSNDAFAGSPAYRAQVFGEQRSLGVGMIRQTFDWAEIEGGPDNYDFSRYDEFVGAAAAYGITVLPVLFDPPPFRSSKPARHAKPGTYFPRNYGDLGSFGAVVARRYGPNGSFWASNPAIPRHPITSYQVWNEPNLPVYSPPKPSARKYVKLLRATGSAIKAVDPSAEIVTAGLPDSTLSKPNLFKYIAAMYRAGAKGSFDTIGINPYAPSTRSMLHKLERIRRIMRRHGDGRAALWITELGWSDKGPPSAFRVGAHGQAKKIRQTLAALKRARSRLRLRGFFYFSWRDGRPYAPRYKDFWGLHTGLLRTNGSRKPAYRAFKRAVKKL